MPGEEPGGRQWDADSVGSEGRWRVVAGIPVRVESVGPQLAVPGFPTLSEGEADDDEAGRRVGPPQAGDAVGQQAAEGRRGLLAGLDCRAAVVRRHGGDGSFASGDGSSRTVTELRRAALRRLSGLGLSVSLHAVGGANHLRYSEAPRNSRRRQSTGLSQDWLAWKAIASRWRFGEDVPTGVDFG